MSAGASAQPTPSDEPTGPAKEAGPDAAPNVDAPTDDVGRVPAADEDTASAAGSNNDQPPSRFATPIPLGGEAPPIQWSTWEVKGEFLEDAATVRAFLSGQMRAHPILTRAARDELSEFCASIGYDLRAIDTVVKDSGTEAVLVLHPITLIRRVVVTLVDQNLGESLKFWKPKAFEDEIARRMRLRQGASLAITLEKRDEQFKEESARVTDYLRDEGFFEATVLVTSRPAGPWAITLHVDVIKGPRYTVGKLQVTGATAISAAEIGDRFRHDQLCLVQFCFGTAGFSRQQLNADVQTIVDIYQRRGYPAARVRTNFDPRTSFKRNTKTVEFTIIVQERRKVDVVFEGHDSSLVTDEELSRQLTFTDEGSFDDVEIDASADAIRRYYQSRGRFEALVTWERERFEFFERIVFTIQEGPALRVRQVSFVGNRALTDDELRAATSIRAFRSVPLFGTSGAVTTARIDDDIAALQNAYALRGFDKAEVFARVSRDTGPTANAAALAAAVASGLSSSDLYVQFVIAEGPQQLVAKVEFSFLGTQTASPADLAPLLSLEEGGPFVAARVRADTEALRRAYFQRGRPHAEISTRVVDGETPQQKLILHEIKENPPVRFGRVVVRGNFKTQDWVILDELGYKEGRLLTLDAAERGQQDVRRTGLFDSVRVALVDFDNANENTVNVLVQVEERHDYAFLGEAAVGVSSDSGYFGQARVLWPNLFGIGLKNDLELTVGTQLISLEDRFTTPQWISRKLIGVAFGTELAGFYRNETTPRFGDLETFGASAAFTKSGRRGFFRNWFLSLRYDFRQRSREEDLVRAAGASDDLQRAPITTRTGAVGPQLVIDRRNNPLLPTSGYKLEFRALYADRLLLGQSRFVKLGASAQHFFELGSRLLVTNYLRYDHGVPLGQDVLLPEVERFFAGGDTTVRGFDEDRLATEIIETVTPPLMDVRQLRVLPAGGNVRMIHNFDVQVRVATLFGVPLASAIFLDSGLVTNSLDGFEFNDTRHSVGVALARIVAPVGALSIEYAVPLDPKLGDDPRGRLHFNLGVLFN